jgi:hypothetical protein
MNHRITPLLLTLTVNLLCCGEAVRAEVAQQSSVATPPAEAPPSRAKDGPIAIHSNTTHVEALVARGTALWVATRGGLEQYDLLRRTRVAVYSTLDGLPSLFVQDVTLTPAGLPAVVTAKHDCVMHAGQRRFSCTARRPTVASPPAALRERIEGVAVTARWSSPDGAEWLGTAGRGLWLRHEGRLRRLTPTAQIAGNHVVAIAEWNEASWFATFDRGLTRLRDGQFTSIPLGPRLLNDVLGTASGLFVATSEGLYVSRDGEAFQRDLRVTESFINDLAYDPRKRLLYATATNSLWELRLDEPRAPARATYLPGGSRSLQAVDLSPDGTVFVASEDRGVLRRNGKQRFVGFDRLSGYPSSWATDVLALDGKAALFGSLRDGVFPVGGRNHLPTTTIDPWILFLGRDALRPETLFVGTQGGALLLEKQGPRALVGLPDPCVHAMARLSSGLWVGTEGGLAQYL